MPGTRIAIGVFQYTIAGSIIVVIQKIFKSISYIFCCIGCTVHGTFIFPACAVQESLKHIELILSIGGVLQCWIFCNKRLPACP
jgi:hypothetical protein